MIRCYQNHRPLLGEQVYVDPMACVSGTVTLADDVSIWPGSVLRGDVNHIHIGARSNIQDNCTIHCTHKNPELPNGYAVTIGEEVTVGHNVVLHGCTIAKHCLIGIGSIILDNVTIDEQVMLGAGSLVPPGKHLQSGYLYLGSPVRQIRRLNADEIANFAISAQFYVTLKNQYLLS